MKVYSLKLYNFFFVLVVMALISACQSNAPTPITNRSVAMTQTSVPPSRLVEQTVAELRGLPIEEFFEESFRRLLIRDPDVLIYVEGSYANVPKGPFAKYGITNDRFTNISPVYVSETQQLTSAILDLLRGYDRSSLTYDQQVAYDIYEWYLDDQVRGFPFTYYDYPINSAYDWSRDYANVILVMGGMPIITMTDAQDYLARLSEVDTYVEQLLERMKECEKAGVLPTKYMLNRSLAQISRGYSDDPKAVLEDPTASPLYVQFKEKLEKADGIDKQQKEQLLEKARIEIERTVIPAWKRLQEHLVYLESIAPAETGAWNLPNGEAYYAYWLRSTTTTDLSAEEMYELGVKELRQIHAEMRQVAHDELGYPRDITIYQLYKQLGGKAEATDVMDLVKIHQAILGRFEAKKDAYFNIYPEREIVFKIAYPGVTYNDPSFDDPGPLIIRLPANMGRNYKPYELSSYFYHEQIPGHAASQILLRQLDLPAPTFQKSILIAAYLEGWALYVEQLAWEMGLYADDPLSNLGRLEYKALRAARLTAEVGMQTKGWTLEEAASYISEATGRPSPPNEALRYLVSPGQGCSYYIGYLKIMELRQRAKDRLGDKFDIREFHDTILRHGQMPLFIMERVVDDWIEGKLKE